MDENCVCHINGYRLKDTEARKTAEAAAKAAEVAKKAADSAERSAYATALLANQAKSEAAGAVTTANGAANIAMLAEQKADETQKAALLRIGGTMTGSLDMGGKTILNARHIDLNEGLSIKDWGSGAQVVVSPDPGVRGALWFNYLLKNGNYTRVILSNVSDPVNDYDAANKKFVVDTIAAALEGLNEVSAPVRGTDYWTPADQESIVQQVIAALGTPVFGRVDADNNIILTGELVDGTYTVKYEDGEGNVVEIGTLERGAAGPAYTNLADPTSADWLTDKRLNSSAEIKEQAGAYVTNYIPVKAGDVVRIRGLDIRDYCGGNNASTHFYNASKSKLFTLTPATSAVVTWGMDGTQFTHTIGNGITGDTAPIEYVRFTGILFDGYTVNDIIITVNQEITE